MFSSLASGELTDSGSAWLFFERSRLWLGAERLPLTARG
jgi:hypothetical protein